MSEVPGRAETNCWTRPDSFMSSRPSSPHPFPCCPAPRSCRPPYSPRHRSRDAPRTGRGRGGSDSSWACDSSFAVRQGVVMEFPPTAGLIVQRRCRSSQGTPKCVRRAQRARSLRSWTQLDRPSRRHWPDRAGDRAFPQVIHRNDDMTTYSSTMPSRRVHPTIRAAREADRSALGRHDNVGELEALHQRIGRRGPRDPRIEAAVAGQPRAGRPRRQPAVSRRDGLLRPL